MDETKLAGRRILIVEDEVIVAFNIECEVADAGGTVVGPAHSVAEAIALLDGGEPIDAAVLDINLAGQKVWPVAEALSARAIPFLFASANCHDPNTIDSAFARVPCLDKPVAMRRLIDALAVLSA